MKYGMFNVIPTKQSSQKFQGINLGDNMQLIALNNIYKEININEEDIIKVDWYNINNYSDDYIILPFVVNFSSISKLGSSAWPPPANIIPLFLSFNMTDSDFPEMFKYLKKHEPIGCRDEATTELLLRKGILAFTTGCYTITLPQRNTEPKNGKVFFIDTPNELEEFIPEELRKNCEYISHNSSLNGKIISKEDSDNINNFAIDLLDRYKYEASLIVTSKLHAIAPCIGMGIPVILTLNNIDGRFAWLEKLIPFYDKNNYKDIDWNPQVVDKTWINNKMIECFQKRLIDLTRKYEDLYDISSFWSDRTKFEYDRVLCGEIDNMLSNKNKDSKFTYVIWGAGAHGQKSYEFISKHYPNSKIKYVADTYTKGKIWGVELLHPSELEKNDYDYVILTSYPGRFDEKKMMDKLNKIQGKDYCFCISIDYSDIYEN